LVNQSIVGPQGMFIFLCRIKEMTYKLGTYGKFMELKKNFGMKMRKTFGIMTNLWKCREI
jgi:hypothetical protein